MKTTAILSLLLASLSAKDFWLEGTRADGTVSHVGGATGCFGTFGPFVKVEASSGGLALFYDDYGCKGKQIWDVTEGKYELPRPINAKSIEIFNLGDL